VRSPAPDTGTKLDLSAVQALAANPAKLVDTLDQFLLHGSMSDAMASSIVKAVAAVSATTPMLRVQTAIYLVVSSSQYQVQR
jgi:hypothetical protein